ncbi:hypothetical protein ACTWPT_25985 [Nonomuraea sp. 3N208]|uniref:hypothetical protein n=1 Tax=Nonomuraea sp. 3N208 TaxID=3457421 RepID=UPI003FD30F0F
MRREWELEDLIECWTLDQEEFALLANKSGATRPGFVILSPQGSVSDVYDLRERGR